MAPVEFPKQNQTHKRSQTLAILAILLSLLSIATNGVILRILLTRQTQCQMEKYTEIKTEEY